MDSAIVGFIGVIAGAVVTGGIAAANAVAQRRLDARTAARLLASRLEAARQAVIYLNEKRDWSQSLVDWDTLGKVWDRHAEPLARVLDTRDFIRVSSTFTVIESLALARRLDESNAEREGARKFSPTAESLDELRDSIVKGMRIIMRASFSRREWRSVAGASFEWTWGTFAESQAQD